MKRFTLLLALLAGCSSSATPVPSTIAPDRSVLPDGSEAVVTHKFSRVVRVTTAKGDGIGGDNFGYLDVGSSFFVQSDSGDPADPKRGVTGIPKTGDLKGKMVRAPRENLRPR